VLPAVRNALRTSVSRPEAPLTIAVVVLLFLLVQHRIDRRDPKLARVRELPDLAFGRPVRR
jgi:hypothetical protein